MVEIPTVTAMFEHSLFLLIDDWKILSKYVAMISVTGTLKLLSSVDVELIDSLFFLLITFIRSFHSNIIVAFIVIRTLINDLLNKTYY